MDLSQHAAYLRGLAEGKGLTEDAEKGDFVKALLSCLNDMAEEIESLEEYVHELTEYAEAIDEDLGDVEDMVFDEFADDDDIDFDDDEIFVETECPVCGETVGYYQGDYDEPVEVLCPNCDAVVAVIGEDDYEEVEDDELVLEDELDED